MKLFFVLARYATVSASFIYLLHVVTFKFCFVMQQENTRKTQLLKTWRSTSKNNKRFDAKDTSIQSSSTFPISCWPLIIFKPRCCTLLLENLIHYDWSSSRKLKLGTCRHPLTIYVSRDNVNWKNNELIPCQCVLVCAYADDDGHKWMWILLMKWQYVVRISLCNRHAFEIIRKLSSACQKASVSWKVP